MNFIDRLLDKLSEESTWRGLVAIAAAAGSTISPDRASAIVAAALAIIGLINVIKRQP